ncbi:MAG: OadG family protein [Anaerolineales bacterium]|nr:OadG family protein [Anaerolineales bacterium]MCX7756064.1 OadG family protein [Anaerolineales bacterium]MDW8278547.1 OadG family protein [Anaerolineales bacterium]
MENLLNALIITAIGMGITFAAIVVLWGMMAALTMLPDAQEKEENAPEAVSAAEQEAKIRAAAAAVALALAEQELSSARPLPPPPTAIVSAWQLGTRSRQMYEKGRRRK